MKTIFYSREVDEKGVLTQFCKNNNIRLIAQSLIEFQAVSFDIDAENYDVVFFSSPRSYDFYTAAKPIQENQQIACIGNSTAEHIKKEGAVVHFVGADPRHPDAVAKDFVLWLGSRKVLFPISDKSNKSIAKNLNQKQFSEVVVYQTILKPKKLDMMPEIIILSSPSNAESMLLENNIEAYQKVFVFGKTTQSFLDIKNVKSEIVTRIDDHELVYLLKSLIG